MDIEGTFTTGYEIKRQRKPPNQINPEWVKATLETIVEGLPIINHKIKKDDDFDFGGFRQFLTAKLDEFPLSVEKLESIQDVVKARRKAAYEKLDDWGKLGIDWEDFHPNARELVPIPFQWR